MKTLELPNVETPKYGQADLIQYRPGALLSSAIDGAVEAWGVSQHEAARRMAIMFACLIPPAFHDVVAAAADVLEGRDTFGQAANALTKMLSKIQAEYEAGGGEHWLDAKWRLLNEWRLALRAKKARFTATAKAITFDFDADSPR